MISQGLLHVEAMGARLQVLIFEPARANTIAKLEQEFGIRLSPRFRDFYLLGSDGLFASWHIPESDDYGQIDIPKLDELCLLRQQWMNLDRSPDNLNLDYVDDRALGEQIWDAMER